MLGRTVLLQPVAIMYRLLTSCLPSRRLVVDHMSTERDAETHPLAGVNVAAHGPRFLRCDSLYDGGLRRLARRVARRKGIALKQGGYVFVSGPSYDTPMVRPKITCGMDDAYMMLLMS